MLMAAGNNAKLLKQELASEQVARRETEARVRALEEQLAQVDSGCLIFYPDVSGGDTSWSLGRYAMGLR